MLVRQLVTPRLGDSVWREGDKGRLGEVGAWFIQYSHRLRSDLEWLRGRTSQAKERYALTSLFLEGLRGRLPLRARDFISDWLVFVKLAVSPSVKEAEGC